MFVYLGKALVKMFFTSAFLNMKLKGFSSGVTVVFKMVTVLVSSNEALMDGLTWRKMVEQYQIITIMRWKEQVEEDLHWP